MESTKKSSKNKNTLLKSGEWREGYISAVKAFEERNKTSSDQVREAIAGLIEVPLNLEKVDAVYKRIDGFSHGLLEFAYWS